MDPSQTGGAGWFPDPGGTGGQRYWDGVRWTEHVAPAPAPAGYAPAGTFTPAPAYAPAYGGPGFATGPTTSSMAIVSLVFAIIGWAFCPGVGAVVAVILAVSARREITRSMGRVEGRGLTTAALWIAGVQLVAIVAVIVVIIVVAASSNGG